MVKLTQKIVEFSLLYEDIEVEKILVEVCCGSADDVIESELFEGKFL
ncbi:hypothetical protein [Caproiciproducens sp. LBM24188]